MGLQNSPCYGCEQRTVTCKFDGTCSKYDEYVEERSRIMSVMQADKKLNNSLREFGRERMRTALRKQGVKA